MSKTSDSLSPEIVLAHKKPYAGAFLDNSFSQKKLGYPLALATLRTWTTRMLVKEEREMLKASFSRMFGNVAKEQLDLIRQVLNERRTIESEG